MKAKRKLKTKIFFFLALFAVFFVAVVAVAITTVQSNVIKTAHEKLKGDLAMGRTLLDAKHPGPWSIRDGKLFKGDTQMNENFAVVDTIGDLTADTVTIFQDDTRVTTNVKNAAGERAIGTRAAENVIEATLRKGQTFIGKAKVVGTWNQTAYEPIKDAQGNIIGMFYVGVPNTRYDEIIKDITIKVAVASIVGLLIIFALGMYMVNSIVKPINRVIAGLSSSSAKVAEASIQITSSSHQLAEGASQQASSLEETSSSMEELSSMTKQNADNAEQAKTMMGEAQRIVGKVNVNMQNMSEAIDDITRSSEETGKIIKTIDEIAFQTNLLALNAAVEAARAGEAGAGFAVVADEVRNLAMRAAEAAKNTSHLIENTIKSVRNGNDLTKQTQEAFGENVEIAGKIGNLVGEIAAASQEQSHGIDQINRAIVEMDKVTQHTAASAEESASSAEGMKNQAGQMNMYVGELMQLVNGQANGAGSKEPSKSMASMWARLAHKEKKRPLPDADAGSTRVIRADQVIPMEGDPSKEF